MEMTDKDVKKSIMEIIRETKDEERRKFLIREKKYKKDISKLKTHINVLKFNYNQVCNIAKEQKDYHRKKVESKIDDEITTVKACCIGLVHPDQNDQKRFTSWLQDVVIFHLNNLRKNLPESERRNNSELPTQPPLRLREKGSGKQNANRSENSGGHLFETIKKYSKFCSSCGKPLDLDFADWHLPFCKECRMDVIRKEISSILKKERHYKVFKKLAGLNKKNKSIWDINW